jgi:hypothetical protein
MITFIEAAHELGFNEPEEDGEKGDEGSTSARAEQNQKAKDAVTATLPQ